VGSAAGGGDADPAQTLRSAGNMPHAAATHGCAFAALGLGAARARDAAALAAAGIVH
jgi:hypothetical protein